MAERPRYVAKKPGALPPASGAEIGGVKLPEGARPTPNAGHAMHPARAKKDSPIWVSAAPVPDVARLVGALAAAFPKTGLWPVVLESLEREPARPWIAGEFDPSGASDASHNDPRSVLEGFWSAAVPSEEEDDPEALEPLAPFGRAFPGLARASRLEPPAALAAGLEGLEGSLGLAAVTRPADLVAAVGWLGPINAFSDMGMLAAVLRSWEDRFDAYVVGVGFDTLALAVGRPPRDLEHARAIAAEHFAICSDCVHQGEGTIEALAATLVDAPSWGFWWN